MYVIIVANAPALDAAPFRHLLHRADMIIAADGGAHALVPLSILPHIIIGDLDSLRADVLEQAVAAGVEIRRYPAEKDETDLELALLLAGARGATRIDILGALGGRWDQTFSNVALLALPELAACHVRILEPPQELFLVRDERTIVGQRGDTVSLIPVGGTAHGITIRGFRYPLDKASLPYERSRGISNVLEEPAGTVRVRQGMLLVIHSRSPDHSY